MRLFGFELSIRKAGPQPIYPVTGTTYFGNWGPVRESFSGAWQQDVTVDRQPNLLASSVVYTCVTGIAADIAKNRIKLDQNNDGIWIEVTSGAPWLPVLRKPNHFQTRIEFIEQWQLSKLLCGNTYVLKERDKRGIVNRLYVLDPLRTRVLVADDGSVFYQLNRDPLSQVTEISGMFDIDNPIVPASEIIHDRMPALFHPLMGVSPLYACAISATLGNKIVANSTNLFGNASRPGGTLSTPTHITDETAARLKQYFQDNFTGSNVGKLLVLGDGLKFDPVVMTAENAQLAEQYQMSVADVARAFHYPIWKVTGQFPAYSSGPEALTMMYYTDCLQSQIEKLELCLDEGLEFPSELRYGTEVDTDNLLRMDTASLYEAIGKGISGGLLAPNEGRFKANYRPVTGGDSPYLQQQNFSLAALAKRDAQADPFAKTTTPSATPTETQTPPRGLLAEDLILFDSEYQKEMARA